MVQVAPTEEDVSEHIIGASWSSSDRLTVQVSFVAFKDIERDYVANDGTRFEMDNDGVGDIAVVAYWRTFRQGRHQFYLQGRFSLPSGKTDEDSSTPFGNWRLPYCMQIGSGTVDFLPGIVYMGQAQFFSWGASATGTLHIAENSED